MKTASIVTLLLLTVASVLAVKGGIEVQQGQYSYLVYIMVDPGTPSTYACSGGIVSKKYVISAGHCSFGGRFQVIINRSSVRGYRLTDLVDVVKVTRPNNFGKDGLFNYNDIAIWELAREVEEAPGLVQYLNIGLNPPPVDSRIIIAGFGQLAGPTGTPNAHWGVTKVSPDSQCRFNSYRPEVAFCSVDPNIYACPGDSGTPIVVKPRDSERYVQVGVNSFGYDGPCGFKQPDSVIGKISAMIDFIRANTQLAPPTFVQVNYNNLVFPDGTSPPATPTTTSAPAPGAGYDTRGCWTCPAGFIHWFQRGGYTSAPGGDRCACVRI
ncbi:trypsin PRSS [Acrasis kona]|uniref:Trypsin PRSS n=1 Tax=Acrasis kona TaxID=1008807 RepID=A0AAW2YL59_9EUKA